LTEKGYDKIDAADMDYKYLTKMPMDSVTEENVAKLQKEHRKKVKELDIIQKTSPEEMWLTELTTLEEEYLLFKEEKERMHDTMPTVPKKKAKKVVPKLME